jgi:hypothetical protein
VRLEKCTPELCGRKNYIFHIWKMKLWWLIDTQEQWLPVGCDVNKINGGDSPTVLDGFVCNVQNSALQALPHSIRNSFLFVFLWWITVFTWLAAIF